MNEEDPMRHLKNIADAITDNIINTPDDEILEEVKEDHGDPEYEANIMKNIINKVKTQVSEDKFAQANMDEDKKIFEELMNEVSQMNEQDFRDLAKEADQFLNRLRKIFESKEVTE